MGNQSVTTVARLADEISGELNSSVLLERPRELVLLERRLADAGTNRGRLVIVEGPAGIARPRCSAPAGCSRASTG